MHDRAGIHALLVAIVLATLASLASADGKFFGRATLVRDPTMPSQRAVLAWHDGMQTLIVESAFDASGVDAGNAEFGWVVPLPARPIEIAPTTTNALATLDAKLAPRIETARSARNAMRTALVVLCATVGLVVAARLWAWRVTQVLTVIACVLLAAALLLPALGTARSGGSSATVATDVGRIGSYDVQVLEGNGDAVIAWLTEHGFRHDDESRSVIAEYATDGWAFAAMRIAADTGSIVAPHPLRFVCPSPEPVYPMRLTGVGQTKLALDLYVLAARGAEAAHCTPWRRITLRHDVAGGDVEGQFVSIESPDMVALAQAFPRGAFVATRLHGVFDRDAMRADVRPILGFDDPVQHTLWETGAPLATAAMLLFYVLAAGALALTHPSVWTAATRHVRGVAIGALAVAALIAAPALAKETVTASIDRYWLRQRQAVRQILEDASRATTEAQVRDALADGVIRDELTPDSDDPFGYRFRAEKDGSWSLTVVNENGGATTIRSPTAPDR